MEKVINLSQLYEQIKPYIDEEERYRKARKLNDGKGLQAFNDLRMAKKLAYCNKRERAFVCHEYSNLLYQLHFGEKVERAKRKVISEYVDYHDLLNNPSYWKYEMLLKVYDLKDLILKYKQDLLKSECSDDNFIVTSSDIDYMVTDNSKRIKEYFEDEGIQLDFIAQLIFSCNNGLGLLDTSQYHAISDIAFIDEKYIYIIIGEDCYYLKFLDYPAYGIEIEDLAIKLTKRRLNAGSPHVIGELANGSRYITTGYKLTPFDDFPTNIRVFNLPEITPLMLKDEYKTFDEKIYEFLRYHKRSKGRSIITGDQTNVGKTTLLIALVDFIRQKDGIGLIDKSYETFLRHRYPDKNIIALIGRNDEDSLMLLEAIYKYSRRFILYGEIVSYSEAMGYIKVCKSFDVGMLATLHSATIEDSVFNLTEKIASAKERSYDSREQAESIVCSVLDIVIHLERHKEDSNRVIISEIAEVISLEKSGSIEVDLADESFTYR